MKKTIKIFLAAVAGVIAVSACQKGDHFDANREVIVFGGAEKSSLITMPVDDVVPVVHTFTINATGKLESDARIELAIDNSLIDSYNASHKTNYFALPENVVKLDSTYVNIAQGKASSAPNRLSLTSLDCFEDGKNYMIPVTIKSVSGTSMEVLEAERTIYVRIARTLTLSAIDMDNAGFSSEFVFADNLQKDLDQYTFEIKIYPYRWNGMTPNLSRLCAFKSADDKNSLLYRFGEKNDVDILQVKTISGELISNTHYEANKWTMLSVVYDGSNIGLYNDGVKDVDNASSSESFKFGRIELGMAWTNYGSAQLYHGRVAEIRVWDRALSSSEIKGGLCGVPANSEGLVAYYKFNETSGSVFKDATGHGYDMDWDNSVREVSDGGGLVPQHKGDQIRRVKDALNKCAN